MAAREHVVEIERVIGVIKEKEQCIVLTIAFKYLHKQILIHIIYYVVIWINSLPNKNGISQKHHHVRLLPDVKWNSKSTAHVNLENISNPGAIMW